MHSISHGKDRKNISRKEKQLRKLINNSENDDNDSEHELSYYLNDRVRMMKEVLKVIKPKKIRSMAPNCMKNLDNEEINSMLLEELLGISNKRLKAIFNGQSLNEDSSSTDEDEQQSIDVISLDDISDDDFIIDLDSDDKIDKPRRCRRKHKPKIKEEPKTKKIKREKQDRSRNKTENILKSTDDGIMDQNSQQHLMSVLELLELQARARAIRSQLALESNKKNQEQEICEYVEDVEEDAVILQETQESQIIISSSDSENDECINKHNENISSQKELENASQDDSDPKNVSESMNNDEKENSLPNKDNAETPVKDKALTIIENVIVRSSNESTSETSNSINNGEISSSDSSSNPSVNIQVNDIPLPEINNHIEATKDNNDTTNDVNKTIAIGSRHKHKKHKHKRKKQSENEHSKPQREELASKSNLTNESSNNNGVQEAECSEKKIKDKVNFETPSNIKLDNDNQSVTTISADNDGDGIILNVDQSEMECIELD